MENKFVVLNKPVWARLLAVAITFMAWALLATGCGSSSSAGSVTFKLENDGTPATPYIAVPEEVTKLKMEIFQLEGDKANNKSSKYLANQDASESANSKVQASDSPNYSLIGDDDNKGSYGPFSQTVDYVGDGQTITISDIASGAFILKVSALDSEGTSQGYVQQRVNVNGGKQEIRSWLLPGAAPEGYLYFSNSSSGKLVRLSLASGETEDIGLNGETPGYLFAAAEPSKAASASGDLFCTTGGDAVLKIAPSLATTNVDITEIYVPKNGTYAESNSKCGVILYYPENGVRFYNFSDDSYSDSLYTGAGAGLLSNVAQGKVAVYNETDMSAIMVDMEEQDLDGSKFSTLDQCDYIALNKDASRLWCLCSVGNKCIHIFDTDSHDLVKTYTTQIALPSCALDTGEYMVVADAGRQELIYFNRKDDVEEIERKTFKHGRVDRMMTDGQRLYCLSGADNSMTVVDLSNFGEIKTYSVGASPRSMVWVK